MNLMDKIRDNICEEQEISKERFYLPYIRDGVKARKEFCRRVRDLGYTVTRIGDYIGANHSTVVCLLREINASDRLYLKSIPDVPEAKRKKECSVFDF